MKNRNLDHSDNWATPKELYNELDDEFLFSFDPCPFNVNEIRPEDDGLLKDWGYSNFINPPYSRKLKEAFILKAIAESQKGKICVMLIPVSTSTKIFHDHILPNAKEIRYIKGRVKFQRLGEDGKMYTPPRAGMHDSMIVIFNPHNLE